VRGPLNLATRPVRNERLPGLVFAVAAVAMLLVTVQHAFIAYRLMPARSKALAAEVESLHKESDALDEEKAGLAKLTFDPKQKAEWAVLKTLIDRRTLSWSRLFEVLEKVLPNEVRLVSVNPRVREGKYELDMTIRSQTVDDGFKFIRRLEQRDEFADVSQRSVDGKTTGQNARPGEAEFQLTMRYLVTSGDPKARPPRISAQATPTPRPSPRPAPTSAGAGEATGEAPPAPESSTEAPFTGDSQ
jgi:Tfp pilus assembly protein PilN